MASYGIRAYQVEREAVMLESLRIRERIEMQAALILPQGMTNLLP